MTPEVRDVFQSFTKFDYHHPSDKEIAHAASTRRDIDFSQLKQWQSKAVSALDHTYKELMTDLYKSNKDNLIFQAFVECASSQTTLTQMFGRPVLQSMVERLETAIRRDAEVKGPPAVNLAGGALGGAGALANGAQASGGGASAPQSQLAKSSANTIPDAAAQEISKRVMLLRSEYFNHVVVKGNDCQAAVSAAAAQLHKPPDQKISLQYELRKQTLARVFAVGSFGEAEKRPWEAGHYVLKTSGHAATRIKTLANDTKEGEVVMVSCGLNIDNESVVLELLRAGRASQQKKLQSPIRCTIVANGPTGELTAPNPVETTPEQKNWKQFFACTTSHHHPSGGHYARWTRLLCW